MLYRKKDFIPGLSNAKILSSRGRSFEGEDGDDRGPGGHHAPDENAANASAVVVSLHDAQGRRIGRVVDGRLERAGVYGDALAPLAGINAAGQVTKPYVYAHHVNVPDMIVVTGGPTHRVVTDHLGSVRAAVKTCVCASRERCARDLIGS